MKTIYLKSLTITNFKGIKSLVLENLGMEVLVRGANASGKSTIMDSFTWLLFGKNSQGRTDFEIKPLTKDGPVHMIDSEVTAVLEIGRETSTLKKVFHEIWSKPKGATQAVFSGNENLYFWNNVPVTMREYNGKVELLCPENLFRLLTNPLYFPKLPWQEQRSMLFKIAGEISDSQIAAGNKAWEELFVTINAHKTIDEYKREIGMEKRKIKDLLDNIPARIDEAQRSIPESEDWDSIKESITSNSKEIEAIDKEISDISAAIETENREYRSKQEVINRKRSELQAIEFDYKKKLSSAANEISFKITDKEGKLHNLRAEDLKHAGTLERLQQELEGHRTARQNLLNQWSEINAVVEPVLSENDLVCYACKQPLDSSDIQSKQNELTANYNTKKANDLATNRKHGLQTKALIEAAEKAISNTNVQREFIAIAVKNLTTEIETLKADLTKSETLENAWKQASEADVNYIRIKREISVLEEAIGTEPKRVNISEQTERKSAIQKELSSLIQRLNSKEFVDRATRRIDELNREQKELAQKLADLEKIEYAITGFTKAKISVIEEKINSMFSLVKVKMFNSQVNGGETETCELTVDGVPWSDLNNAMKINSGLDVINTLSKYYDIACPIFADNAEAVNDLLPMNAQTIKLYVTTDPILTIN